MSNYSLNLLSATVGTLVIDGVDEEALATGWDDCTHALFRTSKIRILKCCHEIYNSYLKPPRMVTLKLLLSWHLQQVCKLSA